MNNHIYLVRPTSTGIELITQSLGYKQGECGASTSVALNNTQALNLANQIIACVLEKAVITP